MQADTFVDERMKIMYVLSFMCGGTAQVWAANETMAVITRTSQMQTLNIFLESIEKTFGDLDQAWMAHAQLHKLKMTPGTMAEDYTAQFEMLVGRTSFNNAALEDIYVWGLPNSILQKIFAQVTLPNGFLFYIFYIFLSIYRPLGLAYDGCYMYSTGGHLCPHSPDS